MLRRVLSRDGLHKLSPMWEGPFQGCSCFQARLRALGDSGGGATPERMEHPAPPEVLPLKRPRAFEEGECL